MNGNKVDIELRPDTVRFKTRKGSIGKQAAPIEAHRVWTRLWHWMTETGLMSDRLSSSVPVRLTSEDGGTSSTHTLDTNPLYLEKLMGWPSGWTDIARPVTGFAVWQQHARGALSKLTSKPIGRDGLIIEYKNEQG